MKANAVGSFLHLPVLTYHSMNVSGNTCSTNDHVALASDLLALHGAGFKIVRTGEALERLRHADERPAGREVAITFDDGSWFDWHDLVHPTFGLQRSFANILRDFAEANDAFVHATSFVIVSPSARSLLDQTCMHGSGWWGHDWWGLAESEGIISIESHSWDHNHDSLPSSSRADPVGGRFDHIDSDDAARLQIAESIEWLDQNVGRRRPRLIAWPYGQSSSFLLDDWMPKHADACGLTAAFGTRPATVTRSCPRWDLPRFVCGRDWRTSDELLKMLSALHE